MNVLIACEESQTVCKEFRKLGHHAFSCDLQKCSGGHPEFHFNCDVFEVLKNNGGITQAGEEVRVDKWDLMIAHPPCTFLAVSGARWLYNKDGSKNEQRWKDMEAGAEFFMKLANADIERIAVENPVGVMSKRWRKPTQIIQPWQFGDPAKKKTCLWLKNLPKLEPLYTEEPDGLEYVFQSGKKNPKWYFDALSQAAKETAKWVVDNQIDVSTPEGKKAKKMYYDEARRRIRSKTFPGIAMAMAATWGGQA